MLKNIKILLVEDDEDLRIIFSSELKELNCILTVAHSGNEARRLLENGLEIDFIVSDYSMNDGDGLTLLEYLAEKNYSLPFIFFTNNINPEIPVLYKGFLGVVHKFHFDELVKKIRESLGL